MVQKSIFNIKVSNLRPVTHSNEAKYEISLQYASIVRKEPGMSAASESSKKASAVSEL